MPGYNVYKQCREQSAGLPIVFSSIVRRADVTLLSAVGRHSPARNFCGMKGLFSLTSHVMKGLQHLYNAHIWLCTMVNLKLMNWREPYFVGTTSMLSGGAASFMKAQLHRRMKWIHQRRLSKCCNVLCRYIVRIKALPRSFRNQLASSPDFIKDCLAWHPMKCVGSASAWVVVVQFWSIFVMWYPRIVLDLSTRNSISRSYLMNSRSHRMGWPRKGSSWNRYRNSI